MNQNKPLHINWLVDTKERLTTSEGKEVVVLEFQHKNDPTILSDWAKNFRNHYCLDSEIDFFRKGYGFTRSEYLNKIKFPDQSVAPGPSIRSGDFGEILMADYLEYSLNYWVPRTRYGNKTIRNESTKGSDILGFKFVNVNNESSEDTLAIFESKSQFSGSPTSRLQDAVNDSGSKDQLRKAESLNAIKQRLHDANLNQDAERIERFQNPIDNPYKEISGAVALFSTHLFDMNLTTNTVTNGHPNKNQLVLIVIKGNNMMDLVHDLYRRAANEA
ncbi:MAG: DUF1837 domain-containing protein [Candidatus Omnitrophica bacterium]|nr:DUF1837 domain-containing protein [Candidatus Omnitrophota bacterium]